MWDWKATVTYSSVDHFSSPDHKLSSFYLPLQQLWLHQNSAEVKLPSVAAGWVLQELCAVKPPFWTPARGKFTDEMWHRPRNAISSFHICEMDETRFLILQPWCQCEDMAALHQCTGGQNAHVFNWWHFYSGLRTSIYSSTCPVFIPVSLLLHRSTEIKQSIKNLHKNWIQKAVWYHCLL